MFSVKLPLLRMRIVKSFKSCFPGSRQAVSMKNVAKRAIPSCCVESCPYIKRELKEDVCRLVYSKNGRAKLKRKCAPVIVEGGKPMPH